MTVNELAARTGAEPVVLADGAEIGEDVREAARAKGVNLLASPRPAFELCAALAGEADK